MVHCQTFDIFEYTKQNGYYYEDVILKVLLFSFIMVLYEH